MSSGGKTPTATSQTITQSSIPEWAQPYAMDILGKTTALTDINKNPYTPYSGERVAGFTPMQEQAFGAIGSMTPSAYLGQAGTMAGQAGLGALGAQGAYEQSATDPAAMQKFMSPYMQNVLDVQKQQAIRDYSRALPGLGAQAARAGGYGGSRAAMMQAEGNRNLQNQLQQIQTTGMQSAFDQARQAQQYGADLGMRGYNTALQGAGVMGQLGQTEFGQKMDIADAQFRSGEAQRMLEQQRNDVKYQSFADELNHPYKQLGFASDILRGLPSGSSTSTMYGGQPSSLQTLGGLGLGLGSLYMQGKAS